MFFLRKRDIDAHYERIISELKESHSAQVSQLNAQVSDLRKLVFTSTSATQIPLVALEADAVLSQKETVIEIPEIELERIREVESEADRLFSGNY